MKLKKTLRKVQSHWLGKVFSPTGDRQIARWLQKGRPNPPPAAVKTRNILTLADLFSIDTLVETGTYRGDTIAATLNRFERIYSIEIESSLAAAARARFRRVQGKVHLFEGDSGVLLPKIIEEIPSPALFWLDGHYSGKGTGRGDRDTPVLAEIEVIATLRRDHGDVIIVDDARLFGRALGYPPLDDFTTMLGERLRGDVRVADDAIFVLPR